MHTHNDQCDVEPIQTREEMETEAREMAIRLEAEAGEQRMLDEHEEELQRHYEWIEDFKAGHAA
jgi:hypothetical protein